MKQVVRQTGEWAPSIQQVEFLRVAQDSGYSMTRADIARKLDLEPRQWSRWKQGSPKFLAWWQQEMNGYFTEQLPCVYKALLEAATGVPIRGNSDRVAFMQRFDKSFRPAQEIDTKLTVEQLIKSLADVAPAPVTETISTETAASLPSAKQIGVAQATQKGSDDD